MKVLSVLILLLTSVLGFSQTTLIKGRVIDTAGAPLDAASVVLLKAADSTMVQFFLTEADGFFYFKNVPLDKYLLQYSHFGGKSIVDKVTISKEQPFVDMGDLQYDDAILLDEVYVEAAPTPMVIKDDTVEYDSDAFKVRPHEAAEELIKQLPGVEVESDGTIKAHGENVTKVLVDGKEFFGDDPKMATKNLPADAIDKVQVFDKKSEEADFTGVDDGETEKTINLKLKEDKKMGVFGNLVGGYGTNDRYQGKLNVNRFAGKSQVSLLGMANNLNEAGFTFEDYINANGGWQGLMKNGGMINADELTMPLDFGDNRGNNDTYAGGLNYNYSFSKNTELSLSYFYNEVRSSLNQSSFRETALADGAYFTNATADRTSSNQNHRTSFRFKSKIDSTQKLTIGGRASFFNNSATSSSWQSNLTSSNVEESSSSVEAQAISKRMNGNIDATYNKKLKKKGRHFSLAVSSGLNNGDSDVDQLTNNWIKEDTVTIFTRLDQLQQEMNQDLNYDGRISWNEPLSDFSSIKIGTSYEGTNSSKNRAFYDIDEASGITTLNDSLTNSYQNHFTTIGGDLTYKWSNKTAYFSLGAAVQEYKLNGILNSDIEINKRFVNVLPNARFKYKFSKQSKINIRYRSNISAPQLYQLQPIVDNSNPLSIYVGNPDLRAEERHNVTINAMRYSRFSFTNLFGYLRAGYTKDKIINSVSVDSNFVQRLRPVNTKGEMALNGNLSFSAPIKKLKIKYKLAGNSDYSISQVFVNQVQNQRNNYGYNLKVSLENRKKDWLDIAGGITYSKNFTTYSLASNLNQTYNRIGYWAELELEFGKWTFGSTFDYDLYQGDVFGQATGIPLLSAAVARTFGETDRIKLEVSGFDLLNQYQGIDRTANLNYIEETRFNALTQYFMMTFKYDLSKFGNPNAVEITHGKR